MTLPLILAQKPAPAAANQIYLDLTNLSNIPDPLAPVNDAILAIAYTLTVSGFLVHFWASRDNPAPGFSTLLRCLIVIACITILPMLRELVLGIFYYIPKQLLAHGAGVNFAGDRIRDLVHSNAARPDFGILGLERLTFDTVFRVALSVALSGVSSVASFLLLSFYFIQRFAEMVGFGFMPIAFACLTVPALAGKAANYIMSILSILAWPLGFVLTSMAAASVLDVAALNPPASNDGIMVLLIAPFVASVVLTTGTVSTPLVCYYLFTMGGVQAPNVGGTQMSSAMRSVASAATRMFAGK